MQALCDNPTKAGVSCEFMKTGRPSTRPRPPFGAKLHELREQTALTQAQVAEKLDITHRAYAFWEREPTAIKAEQLMILADLFQVSADELIGREAPKKKANGPSGKLRQIFETASTLPRRQQQRIIDIVEDMLVARGVNGTD
jgi:transcriptional regulator with XRE-family HTH domain